MVFLTSDQASQLSIERRSYPQLTSDLFRNTNRGSLSYMGLKLYRSHILPQLFFVNQSKSADRIVPE